MDILSETITLGEIKVVPVGFAFILLETDEPLDIEFIGVGRNVLKTAKGVSQSFKVDSGDIRILTARIKNSDPLKTQTIKYGHSDDVIRGDFNVVAGTVEVSNFPTAPAADSGDVAYTHELGVNELLYGVDVVVPNGGQVLLYGAFADQIGYFLVQNTGNNVISVGDAGVSAVEGFLISPGGYAKFRTGQNNGQAAVVSIMAYGHGGASTARLISEKLAYLNKEK